MKRTINEAQKLVMEDNVTRWIYEENGKYVISTNQKLDLKQMCFVTGKAIRFGEWI